MVDERRQLPESIGGLTRTATHAYRRRFGLYFGVACGGLLFEGLLAYAAPKDDGVQIAAAIIVDALLAALVTIGVIADMREGEPVSNQAVIATALEKWGLIAIVSTLVESIIYATDVDESALTDVTNYLFMLLPVAVLWGSISFATVIATIDEKTTPGLLAISSIGRSMMISFARQNFGRLIALAFVAILPMLIQIVLRDQLELRKVVAWQFFSSDPIDALVTGPLQALFTIFYLDFVRRTSGSRRA